MAICYTLRFPEGKSSKYLRTFEQSLTRWMHRQWKYDFCHPEADESAMDDLRDGDVPQPLSLRITKTVHFALQLPELDDRNGAILRDFIQNGRHVSSHDRSLEIVLHATEFFDIRKAEASFSKLLEAFPEVSQERREEDIRPAYEDSFGIESDLDD
jgi:hypothetical protein